MTLPLPRTRLLVGAALLGAALGGVHPTRVEAQGRGCSWVEPTRNAQMFTIPGQGEIWYLSRPSIRCQDGVRIQADSAVVYRAQSLTHLMGNVRFRDGAKLLTANEARYFTQAGRLQASGRPVLSDSTQGSEIRNGEIVILRRTETRDQEQITATRTPDGARPVAYLVVTSVPDTATPAAPTLLDPTPVAPDSAGAAPASPVAGDTLAADTLAAPPPLARGAAPTDTVKTPYVVEGDRIFLQGDSYFLATGEVSVNRDALRAFADTAEYDQVAERMLLRGDARVEGESYTLTGLTINIALPGGEMGDVRALREAALVGDDLRLTAPLIQLFLADGAMERLVAVPLPGDPTGGAPRTAADSADLARPVAVAEDFELVADSVEVLAPGEVLDRIFAAGRARGESMSRDSLNVPELPEEALRDWIEGDTILAFFAKVELEDLPPGDTITDEYRLRELRAVGKARSLYRFLPEDTAVVAGVDPPAVHYVTGSAILIVMANGEVDRMEVEGPTHGWHLEPAGRRQGRDTLMAPDSALAPPDTGSARPDTAAVGRGAGRGDGNSVPPADGRRLDDPALPGVAPGERGRGRRRGR